VPFTALTVTLSRLKRPLAGDLSSWPVTAAPDDRRPTDPLAHIAGLPGVADAVERARAAVDALRGHRVLRRSSERVSSESALRGARASAALAGGDLSLEELRWSVGDDHGVDGVVRGALRVAAEIGLLQGTWSRAPLQAVARLHTLAAADLVPDDELGRPSAAAAQRLSGLGDLVSAPTTAPAVVVAAVVHAELATMGAFAAGAGVVGRAAGRLTMIGRGLDPTAVSVPEVGHVELGREAYEAALVGYRGGDPGDIARWVVHCADAVVLGAREGVAICESLQRGA
jgi:hypothetical protein